jgi:hypothetical protein
MPSESSLPEIPELVQPEIERIAPFPYDIALIIDDVVFQVMNVDGQQAAQLMRQPKFVRVTADDYVKVGWKYIDGEFIQPNIDPDTGY